MRSGTEFSMLLNLNSMVIRARRLQTTFPKPVSFGVLQIKVSPILTTCTLTVISRNSVVVHPRAPAPDQPSSSLRLLRRGGCDGRPNVDQAMELSGNSSCAVAAV
eukprot:SAG31_NODE_5656_length_2402_cov_1.374729_2_plen_105_part_00